MPVTTARKKVFKNAKTDKTEKTDKNSKNGKNKGKDLGINLAQISCI